MTSPLAPIWGVLPVKGFEAAKSRLAPVLSVAERAILARGMFERVLGALLACPALSGVLVATDSAEVASLAEQRGAKPLRDAASVRTLADVVDAALDELGRYGARAALVLVSDLPDVSVDDVNWLVTELGRFDVVLARDARGSHTNALGLRLGTEFRTYFGSAESAADHVRGAKDAGLSIESVESPALAFDVDTPEDYARLVSRR